MSSAADDPSRRDAMPRQPRDIKADGDPFGSPMASNDADDIPFSSKDEPQREWDADDPRRQRDCFAPPTEVCECFCLLCRRNFMSDRIWFQKLVNGPEGLEGFWMCPTPNCDGKGFTFDLVPSDPNHPANGRGSYCDDDEAADFDEFDDIDDEFEDDLFDDFDAEWDDDTEIEYDPNEPHYRLLDDYCDLDPDDEDMEGEEWKHGLQPGQRPPAEYFWTDEMRRTWEQEQQKYNSPDERPRQIDASDLRFDRPMDHGCGEDDIPF